MRPAFMWRMVRIDDNVFVVLHHRILAEAQVHAGNPTKMTVATHEAAEDARESATMLTAGWEKRRYALASIRVIPEPLKVGVPGSMLMMLARYRESDAERLSALFADLTRTFYDHGELIYD